MKRLAARLLAVPMVAAFIAGACADNPTGPVLEAAPPAPEAPQTPEAPPATPSPDTGTAVPPAPVPAPQPPPPPPAGEYDITVRYIGTSATLRQRQAVAAAVARWESVITGDLSNIPVTAAADACFAGQPAMNEQVDDIVIFVEFQPIDGPGRILGEAGPCYIRNDNLLPVMGHLRLDQADLVRMEQTGTLDAVVLHEIGHILGVGTLWPAKDLLSGADGEDPRFSGAGAISAYHTLGGADAMVPVEGTGEAGTRNGHWRESVFGNELMTGYIGSSTNPLSAMTIASLRDMGYNANAGAAATYALGTTTGSYGVVDLEQSERIRLPQFLVNRNGDATPITGQVSTTPWRTK